MSSAPADLIKPLDLQRMWSARTWLLAAQCFVQGGQYALAPDRPVHLATYAVLRPMGEPGWRAVGVLMVLLAVGLGIVKTQRLRTPPWLWVAVYAATGAVLAFLCVGTLLNHGYLPSTLILPTGLCMSEIDLMGRIRNRRTQPEERECG